MRKASPPVTNAEINRIADLDDAGMAVKDIAADIGRHPDTVRRYVNNLRAFGRGRVKAWPSSSTWSDPARVERLIDLWNKGISARLIGEDIGLSKNAVVGKAHRLGLPERDYPIKDTCWRVKPGPVPPLKSPPVQVWPKETEPMLRHRQCQWFESDELKDANKCGKPAVRGRSWCAEHTARAVEVLTKSGARRPWRPEDDEREVAA